VAHHVVVLADQLGGGKTADLHEGIVGVGDAALEVGLGDDRAAGAEHALNPGNGQVYLHGEISAGWASGAI